MSLFLPKKNVGDKFYADEFNQIVSAINNNSVEINKVDDRIDTKRQYIATDITTDNIEIDRYIYDQKGDSYKLKGNIGEADYTIITDEDLKNYVKIKDDKQRIEALGVKSSSIDASDIGVDNIIINTGIELRSPIDNSSSTIADISGTYEEDQTTPVVTFGKTNPILRNIGEPAQQNDATTKNYVDEQFKILYKKLGLQWQQ